MSSAQSWRLFVAISVPDAIKAELQRVQTELHQQLPAAPIRWTRPDQFHLTLRFLGNVDPARVADLDRAVADACSGFTALELRAERIGFFPGPRYPRVIWAWVHDPDDRLLELQRSIEQGVRMFSTESAEKTFTGHVTLGRCHGIKRPGAEALFQLAKGMADRVFGNWTADHVELIRSDLSAQGTHYTTLSRFALG